jgi:hypothetical protein
MAETDAAHPTRFPTTPVAFAELLRILAACAAGGIVLSLTALNA